MTDTGVRTGDPADPTEPSRAPNAAPAPRRSWGVYVVGAFALIWLLLGLAGGSFEGKLSEVQKNDNSSYLPASAESTKVDKQTRDFSSVQVVPGSVVYERAAGLTATDRAKIQADVARLRAVTGVAADQVGQARFAAPVDGRVRAATISVPLVARANGKDVQGDKLANTEKKIVDTARSNAPDGLTVNPAGPGGLLSAFIDAFAGIDGALLLSAGLVVVVILLIVYRSPVLWFFPLFCAAMALGAAALVIYPLAKNGTITLNGQSQGILSVLVIGAGTDYALLLVSRYREELHQYEKRLPAMIAAWKGAAPAIAASATTVVLGLICLTAGQLNSTRSLGPVCAIGIVCTVAVMLTVLPALLVGAGRWIFWPKRPHVDHQSDLASHGVWSRIADGVGRRHRLAWIVTSLVLLACILGMTQLKTGGLSNSDSFTDKPDAVAGTQVYNRYFGSGTDAPLDIIANADKTDEVIAATKKVDGVGRTSNAVCVATDYGRIAQVARTDPGALRSLASGCAPPQLQVQPTAGRILINATLTHAYDSQAAYSTVVEVRKVLHAIPGGRVLVGGSSAINYDTQHASRVERAVLIPIILLVILIVLGVVLRAILAPILLIASVVLSFTATLGVSGLVFQHLFHFKNADPAFPLFAFVFLVALGIDYNIFLMTRVREETIEHGTRRGILRGLTVTGGVITSAGIVLAATFVVLGVLPLVFLAELGFAVAFGVLLDTVLVRSVLVPALAHDIGKRIWWPSKLAKAAD